MNYIIYKTTNVITNKFYIGMHTTTNINDSYLGSGLILKHSIKKYGRLAHKKEILYIFDNKQDMALMEIKLLDKNTLDNPMCMNLKQGGFGGAHGKESTQWNLENKAKMAKTISKTWENPEIRKRRNDAQQLAAKLPEAKIKLSNAMKQAMTKPAHKEKYQLETKAKIFTEDYSKKMSIAVKKSFENPEVKEKHKLSVLKVWSDPDYKEKMRQKRIAVASTPEFKQKVKDGLQRRKERLAAEKAENVTK